MIAIVLFVVKEGPAITGMLSHELNVALYILSWLVMAAGPRAHNYLHGRLHLEGSPSYWL